MIRIVKVNKLLGVQRATVCYVGRAFAGWPDSGFGNAFRLACPDDYRKWFISQRDWIERLAVLWEACEHGAKPLGCWCCDWTVGDGPTPACHAAVLAELLHKQFGGTS